MEGEDHSQKPIEELLDMLEEAYMSYIPLQDSDGRIAIEAGKDLIRQKVVGLELQIEAMSDG